MRCHTNQKSKAQRIREEAEKLRRVASVPTSGGHGANRMLLAEAHRLERQATELEAAERLFERKP